MAVNLTQDNLEGILDLLKDINTLHTKQQRTKAFIEFPKSFAVTSDDGYSLGEIVFEDIEFVFVTAE